MDVLCVFPDASSGLADEPNAGHFTLVPWDSAASTMVRSVFKMVQARNRSMMPPLVPQPLSSAFHVFGPGIQILMQFVSLQQIQVD